MGRTISRLWGVVRWYLPAFLLSIYPLAIVFGANLGTVPVSGAVVGRSLTVAVGVTFLIIWTLRLLQRDLAARATWIAFFLILINLYGATVQALQLLRLPIWTSDPLFAVPYVVTSGALSAIFSRPWEARPRDPNLLTVVAILFLVVALAPGIAAGRSLDVAWRRHADGLIASTLSHGSHAASRAARDIYYIVLDGLGSANTLHRDYNVDLAASVADLKARGFYVVEDARSNYSQTFLSLASTLNMTYLDDLARSVGTTSTDRRPLAYLIQENALMRMASRSGYRVVVVGSDYMATDRFVHADVCMCSRDGLDEIELAAIDLTPLAALPFDRSKRDPYDVHRQKVLDAFAALEASDRISGRRFVFAHVLAPHPPFVFARDGSARRPDRPFSFGDGDAFRGTRQEYIAGYGEQAQFVIRRLIAVVDGLLGQPGPAPVIVVHGDHGPGPWSRPDVTSVRERMDIFAAYYFPDEASAFYPTMTPLNGARLLASRYLGVELPLLSDRSFFSTWGRPYDFIPDSPSR